MQDYDAFVEKFKPKLTTDDCYTPTLVYEAVKDWAVSEYHLEGRQIVRPFFPGWNFESVEYPAGCVVIDNPPFSILSKIKAFYEERKIDYFLFAPHLTLFSGRNSTTNYIVADSTITYENGAVVNTDFVTNMGDDFIRTAPTLKKAVEEASKTASCENKKKVPKYKYPDTVISSALLSKISTIDFKLDRSDCSFIRALESQKKCHKAIFGSGFLISELRAAELRAAELRAAELRAAEEVTEWQLSEEEMNIIKSLSKAPAE